MLSALKDSKGNFSSYRIAFIFCIITIFSVWAILSVLRKEMIPLDMKLVAAIVSMFLGKDLGLFIEEKYK